MLNGMAIERHYTLREVADLCQVSVPTVRGWQYRGLLKVIRLPGGGIRVSQSEIDRIMAPNPAPLA